MRCRPVVMVVLAVLLTACTPSGGLDVSHVVGALGGDPGDGTLVGFASCDDYLAHVQARALEVVSPTGLPDGRADPRSDGGPVDDEDAPAPTFSDTNVQEVGVDEPDLVVTDGRTLYASLDGALRVLDVSSDVPRPLATIEAVRVGRGGGELADLWDARLLLAGDRLLVVSSGFAVLPFDGEEPAADVLPPTSGWRHRSVLTLLDVSSPADPQVLERSTIDGATAAARLVGDVATVVVTTEQGDLPWRYPFTPGIRSDRAALRANRDVVRASRAEDWLPRYVRVTADGERTVGPVLACDRVAVPRTFAGLDLTTVLPFDLAAGELTPTSGVAGLLAGGELAYVAADTLYVATNAWVDWDALSNRERRRWVDERTTDLHAFDLRDPDRIGYRGSGVVPGMLLSQWAMSEHDGVLRVASTVGDPRGLGERTPESLVTTLHLEDASLATVGQVGGIGRSEWIRAVRFLRDVGYVVTFREVDPLVTLDLSDPAAPRVVGEVRLPGYATYLHPIGDGLLLGVGRDGRAGGEQEVDWGGALLSLVDVRDPAAPQRLDQVTLTAAGSEVDADHHAFLHWPQTGLTVVPFSRPVFDRTTGQGIDLHTGAVGFSATREGGLARLGLLTHADLAASAVPSATATDEDDDRWAAAWRSQIRRSVVVGDRLLTASDAGVKVHDLASLEDVGTLAFAR
jgi:hypothetical protein